jgi:hypothetical protein
MSDPADFRERDLRLATYMYAVGLVLITLPFLIRFGPSIIWAWAGGLGIALVITGAVLGPPPTWLRAWGTIGAIAFIALGIVVLA